MIPIEENENSGTTHPCNKRAQAAAERARPGNRRQRQILEEVQTSVWGRSRWSRRFCPSYEEQWTLDPCPSFLIAGPEFRRDVQGASLPPDAPQLHDGGDDRSCGAAGLRDGRRGPGVSAPRAGKSPQREGGSEREDARAGERGGDPSWRRHTSPEPGQEVPLRLRADHGRSEPSAATHVHGIYVT